MTNAITVLGIESSCDDTAAAIVRSQPGRPPEILATIVSSQTDLHAAFGGVVPEIAARAHAELVDILVEEALTQANHSLKDLNAVAVTAGPGLIGGVLAGVMTAKGIAAGAGLPLIGVNHLAGHALTPLLLGHNGFPYLMLLISGGHAQFLVAKSADDFQRLGGTIDDAPGEAFDKCARIIGLGQPGGPAIEAAAEDGSPERFRFPRPLTDRSGCNMSFSGLKTAVLRARDEIVLDQGGLTRQDQADLAASFQAAIKDVLEQKSRAALHVYMALSPQDAMFCVAGGVASNMQVRAGLETVSAEFGASFLAPPLSLCTDNAAMIAMAGIERYRAGQLDDMSLSARPRWPLDDSAAPLVGFGKKGAKA